MKITDERLNMLLDAAANLFVEKAKAKELEGPANECVEQVISELRRNTELSLTFDEILRMATSWDDIMDRVMDIVHNENPEHDCKACVLMYLCNPDNVEQKELLGATIAALSGKGGDA